MEEGYASRYQNIWMLTVVESLVKEEPIQVMQIGLDYCISAYSKGQCFICSVELPHSLCHVTEWLLSTLRIHFDFIISPLLSFLHVAASVLHSTAYSWTNKITKPALNFIWIENLFFWSYFAGQKINVQKIWTTSNLMNWSYRLFGLNLKYENSIATKLSFSTQNPITPTSTCHSWYHETYPSYLLQNSSQEKPVCLKSATNTRSRDLD